jgi:hypothetical protein
LISNNKSFKINDLGTALSGQLVMVGWDLVVETDYEDDLKEYYCSSKDGPLGAFNYLELILLALSNDPANVEIRFMFYADPSIVGPNKRPFGRKVRENNFGVLRNFCVSLLNGANIEIDEQETLITPSSRRKVKFGHAFVTPSYEVQLVYWKKP